MMKENALKFLVAKVSKCQIKLPQAIDNFVNLLGLIC